MQATQSALEITEKFNGEHYYNVYQARVEQGLPVTADQPIYGHYLAGRKLKNKLTGTIYDIGEVRKGWYRGWYLSLLIDYNDEYETIMFMNLDSCAEQVHDKVHENQELYELL